MVLLEHGFHRSKKEPLARILVVDDDPDIALLVEASLEGAGHRVVTTTSPQHVVPLATEEDVDAIILDLMMPGISGYEVLRALRTNSATARLPVLLLSSANDSRQRVQGLREGAADFIAKPFDPDELVLRVERLVGDGDEAGSRDLEGHLDQYPFWELLQVLQQGRRSGRLELPDSPSPAWLEVHLGGLRSGALGSLTGREAALAMADRGTGRFRFSPAGLEELDTASGLEISINGLLLEAAFLEDELRARQRFVPGPRLLLNAVARPLPPLPESFEAIPVTATYLRVLQQKDTSLEKLLQVLAVAPQKVELAVAWLLEQGMFTTAGAPEGANGTAETEEDVPNRKMREAIRRLFLSARLAGRSSEQVHVLLLGQEASWSKLEALVAGAAEDLDETGWDRLRRHLELRRGGSIQLDIDGSQLSVHAQLLTSATQGRVAAVLSLCTAVVVWLGDVDALADVEPIIDRLEHSERAQTGLLVAPDETVHRRAQEILRGRQRWRLSAHPPRTLGKLLGLL